ncbi:MAG: hypothetical protein JSW73_04795 [Candidatus Woesearchaeota archaeon]|nr:MAG: hypothetical protein JSW73_04795 [Candidatus Woesearchaeota archaeon]
MVYVFEHVIDLLREFGFFAVLLPWLLIFAIFFGILQKTKVLGEQKNINAIVALAAAFFVVAATPIVDAINSLIPAAAYLIVAALLILMVLGFFIKDVGDGMVNKWYTKLGLVILIVIVFLGVIDYTSSANIPIIHQLVVFFLGGGNGNGISVPGVGINEESLKIFGAVALMLIVIFGTMYYISRD